MHNLIWIGAILVILGAAGIGIHTVDYTQADTLYRALPSAHEQISMAMAGGVGAMIAGLFMVALGRRRVRRLRARA